MKKRNITIAYLTAFSVLIVYGGILFINYDSLNEIVPTHINYQGEVDGHNFKYHLWIASLVNLCLLILLGYAIKNPEKLNYLVEINDSNRETQFHKMQVLLSYLAIIVSIMFSLMIYNALNYTFFTILKIHLSIVLPPLFIGYIMNKKNTSK